MTPKQKLLLDFIREFISKNGFAPSYQEMSAGTGVKSRGQNKAKLETLAKAGKIRLTGGARGIELIEQTGPIAAVASSVRKVEAGDIDHKTFVILVRNICKAAGVDP